MQIVGAIRRYSVVVVCGDAEGDVGACVQDESGAD